MWIDPHARGQGLADAMVEAVVAWAVSEGCTAIRLWVVESNAAAIGAYRRLGFTPTGQIDVRERDGITEIHMERSLP
jgi:ribosomal protein S18 acetylase RimI-like enzyme